MSARFEKFADTNLTVTLRGGKEWMCVCPLHDDRGASLQFNVVKGLWVCFGCQQGGTVKSLARRMNVSYEDPAPDTLDLRKRLNDVVKRKGEKKAEPLPESYLRRFGIERHDYWATRGFTDETIDAWDLGYDFMEDQLTIPYRDVEGRLLGVIRRRVTNEFPRYLYPKGFDRIGSLFGQWRNDQRHVVLVEGPLDAIKTWQGGWPAMAIYGSSINPRQVDVLRRIGIREITMFFDYDEAGLKAFKYVPDVLDGFLISKVMWPHDKYCPMKECPCDRIHRPDPGSISEEEMWSFDIHPVGRQNTNRRKAI